MSQEVPSAALPQDVPARHEEENWVQKVKTKCLPGIRITLLLSLILYLSMFGVGIWGMKKCPAEANIPFFLIVIGGVGMLSKFVSSIEAVRSREPVKHVESSLYTIELVFMLLGSFWVFKEYKPNYNPGGSDYCNKTVYMFAFVYLVVICATLCVLMTSYCCFIGCFFFVARTGTTDVDPEAPSRPLHTEDQ
ncbi:transmembrane protein 272-like [Euwallacea fornicatus]|uniref:transmembrane protein 272-like n=1 Tax=Euwallacea fornicatus TaxID=995702 RepID=UPI00338FF710